MSDDDAMLAALADAKSRGVGFIRILRIVTDSYRVSRIDPALVVILDDPTTYLDSLLAAALTVPCDYCKARPNERCRSASGAIVMTHVVRSRAVFEVWRLGHRDGLVDALRRLLNDWDTAAPELLAKHGISW